MCGLAGVMDPRGLDPSAGRERLRRMTDAIRHRGPDDSGYFVDPVAGVGLGFRRLSILELSPLGGQPMTSRSGRYRVAFNGEVYNYVELRAQLEARGARFRGGSDTEVLVAAFDEWGIGSAIERFVGMFAMAVWDSRERSLTLVRDRLGIKPLYYTASSGVLLFASELKAIRWDPAFDATVDPIALHAFLRYLFIPAPRTAFEHVKKLPPGHTLTVSDPSSLPDPTPYWSIREVADRGISDPLSLSDADAIALVEDTLSSAVDVRLRSDVPLGVLLSGGVDSSVVAALAQRRLDRPVRTFSIGFDVREHDESRHARAVAEAIGSDHTELVVGGRDVLAKLPTIATIFDEPLADPSQLPTLLVCELARRDVTVGLAGDGGDEVFGGYNRYTAGCRWIERFDAMPTWVRRPAARGIGAVSTTRMADRLGRVLPIPRLAGEKLAKMGRMMGESSAADMYRQLLGVGHGSPAHLLANGLARTTVMDPVGSVFDALPSAGLLERMMLVDQESYLPDDLLAKVDRTSMSVSLEIRVPILDHRLVELSWRLPERHKIRAGRGKWILRQVLYRHVPRELVDRPKVGFTPPVADWMINDLSDWAGDVLGSRALRESGLWDNDAVQAMWNDFSNGRRQLALAVWAVLQWQVWSDEYAPRVG